MDFVLAEEQKMFQTMVRDFATNEVKPLAAKIDEEGKCPPALIKKAAALGLFGVTISEEYGGCGGDYVSMAIAAEELCRASASVGTIFLASLSLACYPIYKFGNEEQKHKYVTPIAKGEKLACFVLTESGAGSDAGALETTATLKGDKYVLNGTKIFITNGAEAEIAVVFATIDKSLKHRGVTAFIVEKGTAGFSVGKEENKLGIRGSSTAELVFENCQVPAANLLGEPGHGLRIALEAIDSSRVTVAAQAVGIAQAAFDDSLAYAKDRQQFGQPIANFQAIQWMLADMATHIDAARMLTYRAAWLKDCDMPFIKEAAMAKVYAAETARMVTNNAIQIHGGYGYCKDYPVERYLRDAKITEIYEGTSEMQRMTIARHLIKEG
jgi:alkylation response protein AidB-like acyl-CoA dehydrogenase